MEPSLLKPCQLCGTITPNLKYLLKHIRQVHAHRPGFQIKCCLSGCSRVFRTFEVYRNHVYDYHSDSEPVIAQGSDVVPSETDEDCCHHELEPEDEPEPTPLYKRKRRSATWILKIQETHKLTQSTMENILKDVAGFFEDLLVDLHDDVESCLTNAGVDPKHISGLAELFSAESPYANPFAGLETQYSQLKFYKEAFSFVEPQTVLLGTDRQWKGSGLKRTYAEVRDEMIYVPILQTLQSLLGNTHVIKQVQDGHKSTDGIIRDYCDGSNFSNHPLLSVDPNFLQIVLYFDDVEVCNPIGSKRIIHKLAAFYFVIANVHPMFRSKLKHIQLVALARSEDMKKYGANTILSPLIEDIKKLEKGHTFQIGGACRKMWGALVLVPADNLASNALGGFKEGSTAHRGCRHCLATPPEMKQIFEESNLQLRTQQDHNEKCDLLKASTTQRDHDKLSTEYGINHTSILDELQYFDVCSGALVQDVMHDMLEGMLEYEIKELLIVHITKESYYSIDYLNQQITSFELGHMESKDRPSTITPLTLSNHDHKLKQEAAQMWLLGRLLPVMVGHKVPDDDDHWQNFLDLLAILDLLLAPEITEDLVAHLSVLISDHHQQFRELYPHASVTPKMHYLVHAPGLILKYGPLRQHWTMRFEAKHSYFKRMSQSIGNFINLPYTLALRHQKLHCYHTMDQHSFSTGKVVTGPCQLVSSVVAPSELGTSSDIYRVKWVEVDGTMYKLPCALLLKMEDDYPIFGKLADIYVVNSTVSFEVHVMKTVQFNHHFHCYVIKASSEKLILKHNELHSFLPHHVRTIPGHFGSFCVVGHHYFL